SRWISGITRFVGYCFRAGALNPFAGYATHYLSQAYADGTITDNILSVVTQLKESISTPGNFGVGWLLRNLGRIVLRRLATPASWDERWQSLFDFHHQLLEQHPEVQSYHASMGMVLLAAKPRRDEQAIPQLLRAVRNFDGHDTLHDKLLTSLQRVQAWDLVIKTG